MFVSGLMFEKLDFGAVSVTGWALIGYMTIIPMGIAAPRQVRTARCCRRV